MKAYLLSCIFVLSIFVTRVEAEQLQFEHQQNKLSGHYLAPVKNQKTKSVLIFVHGDGDMTFDAEGYYTIIWQQLREQGYAIFSWDKAGVGKSTGNWLSQSMIDRQSEVLAAVKFIQQKYNFTAENTGLIGFSQAGWVLPAMAKKNHSIGFMVGIGFAANWLEQGEYFTQTRLRLAGASKQQIMTALSENTKEQQFFGRSPAYSEYVKTAGDDVMSLDRYQFVLKNYREDARQDYQKINIPTLLLWGDLDLNVNAKQEFNWWQLSGNKNDYVKTKLIENASHGMLKTNEYSSQKFGFKQWLKLKWQGQKALATDFMPTLLLWLENKYDS
ncbi:MAG: alpha-beta hydrolase superfamily lysophospholipase [Alteromonadaceae bacterium]|jgi:alpha-beta hydrolase superfamily lysophospholipase